MWPFKKKPTPESASPAARPLATDAPPDWPPVAVDLTLGGADEGLSGVALLALAAELARAPGAPALRAVFATELVEGGVLEVPLLLEAGGRRYGAYPYPEATPAAAAHYAAVRAAAAELDWTPVYFAPAPLPAAGDAAPRVPAVRNDTLGLAPTEDEPAPGEYAVWWDDGAGPFRQSAAYEALDRAYRSFDRVRSYVMGHVARTAGLVDGDVPPGARVALPGDLVTVPVVGPGGQRLLVSASEEKGVRFHFPVDATPPAYRDRFLRLYADYVGMWAGGLDTHGVLADDTASPTPAEWWALAVAAVRHVEDEQGETAQRFGLIPV